MFFNTMETGYNTFGAQWAKIDWWIDNIVNRVLKGPNTDFPKTIDD